MAATGPWPNGARAAIAFTMDNMGEAADLDRGLWPADQPIGSHHSVIKVLPQMLEILVTHDVKATYFIESWNLDVYPAAVSSVADAGHEVAWHAWRHEAWGQLSAEDERANVERSWKAFDVFRKGEKGHLPSYAGFRMPGGRYNGQRSLKLLRDHGLEYISPSAEDAAVVSIDGRDDSMVVLPFRWSTVDAYYYMDAFSGLRKMNGELPEASQGSDVFRQRILRQIDTAIETGGYLSILCHPFLTDSPGRLQAAQDIVQYLAKKRDSGEIWLARAKTYRRISDSILASWARTRNSMRLRGGKRRQHVCIVI